MCILKCGTYLSVSLLRCFKSGSADSLYTACIKNNWSSKCLGSRTLHLFPDLLGTSVPKIKEKKIYLCALLEKVNDYYLSQNSLENNKVIPDKYGNTELMKIPNFLHLTPVHIAKHCNVLKKFCTKWPDELNDIVARHHFPLEFTQTDYLHSAPSIRDERARVVTLKFELRHLRFDERERFKFLNLIGPNRYDKETDMVTIVADRCPSNRQNYDYLIYVLTALTKETKKFEAWELEAGESDWLKYKWEQSKHKETVQCLIDKRKVSSEAIENYQDIETIFKSSIEKLYNEGDSDDALDQYKTGVLKLLKLGGKECDVPVT